MKENKRLFQIGAKELHVNLVPNHAQIVEEVNKGKGNVATSAAVEIIITSTEAQESYIG